MFSQEILLFTVVIGFFLFLDMKSGRSDKPVPMAKAMTWSGVWIVVSLAFAGYIAWHRGFDQAQLFVTAYALEKSLAVDNLFVFMAIFGSFSVAEKYHHRILHWGIIGALAFRAAFIGLGVGILFGAGAIDSVRVLGFDIKLQRAVFFLFGVVILWSVYGLFNAVTGHGGEDEDIDYSNHWIVRTLRRLFPDRVSMHVTGDRFFTKLPAAGGAMKLAVTPLFLCLVVIELSDVMFAFDSVPAIFAVTQEPFIVYTSNIFAVLGLRSMYFLLAAAKRALCHLEKAVFVILGFIGIKMLALAFDAFHIKPAISLGVVLGLLTMGIAASFIWPEKEEKAEAAAR